VVNLRNNDVEFESGKIMRDTDNSSQESRDTGSDDFKIADADSYNSVVDYFDQYTERFTSHMPAPILAMAKIPAAGKVLDVGTGTGVVALEIASYLGESASVTGIDLSDGMLATAREKALQKGLAGRISYLKMDAEQLALNDNSFDAAVSLYALRHFPNPGKSVAEIYRVLKPGARIVASVGSRPSLFSRRVSVLHCLRIHDGNAAGTVACRTVGSVDNLQETHHPPRGVLQQMAVDYPASR
jgi:ubiquinone/menaquinone biosynthesis C-methylase UbiE